MLLNTTETSKTGLITNSTAKDTTQNATTIDNSVSIPIIIIGIIIIIENALVFLTFATNSKLRKKQSNILVCSQAVIDFLVGSALIPWVEAQKYTQKYLYSTYLICYILFVSLGNLMCLAVDRYLALIKPLKHHLCMSVSRTKRALLITWLTPLFLTMLQLSWHTASKKTKRLARMVFLGNLWSVMLLMCIGMVFMYIKVYQTAAKQIRIRQKRIRSHHSTADSQIKTTRSELRVAHLFGLLLFFFIMAYLPILYLNFLNMMAFARVIQRSEDYVPESLYDAPLYSLAINSVVNPILCLLLKKDYQLIIKRWLCLEWLFEQRRKEQGQRSQQTYCKTRTSDLDSNSPLSETKGGLFGIGKSRVFQKSSPSKKENRVCFSGRDDKTALMSQRSHSPNFKGDEVKMNENKMHTTYEQDGGCIEAKGNYIENKLIPK